MNLYCDLFWTFSKIGVCTFGGGYAMLPILQREVVEKKGWATEEELTDYFAIGQCTPGIIGREHGQPLWDTSTGASPGGVVATLGLVFPPSSSSPSSPHFSAASPTPPWYSTPWAASTPVWWL